MADDYAVVTKGLPQIDALAKVTGRQKFISDLRLPGMLWGRVVRSLHPHARIRNIDISRALRVPGVRGIITAADTPQIPCGPFIPDWEILARDKVIFAGQEIAAVAAVNPDAAEEAAHLVQVDYEELDSVFDPTQAMAMNAPLVHESRESNIAFKFYVERGDIETAFRNSAYVREDNFETSVAFQGYLEPSGSIASYDPISGSYTLWAATQVPYKAQLLYSEALGIERDQLRLIQTPMGGAFGGKFESNFHLVAACLSKKVGQPVRLVNSYEDEFVTAPLRVPMKIYLKLGIDRDGLITARDTSVIADNGARTNYGPAVLSTACYRVDNLYRIFNTRSQGYLVYTNNVPKGTMRGFGNPQMLFAMESLLDALAEDAGIDPGEIRHRNSFKDGDTTVHGWIIGSCGLPQCIETAQKASNWSKRNSASDTPGRRRGIGMACCNHVAGYRPILRDFDGSAAMVKIGPDGRVVVYTGEVDMGQGYATVAAQCAAEELGVPLGVVAVAPVDSLTSILGIGCLGSRGTVMGGSAVKKAAADASQKILTAAATMLDRDLGQLGFKDGILLDLSTDDVLGTFKDVIARLINNQSGQPFIGVGQYTPDTVMPDPVTQYGNPSPSYSFAAHVAEIEVDTETGQVDLVNYVAVNDAGTVINPLSARGQLEGAVVQGMGWALTESILADDGEIVNKNLLDYTVPTFADMPEITPLFVETNDLNGPYGAKGLGELVFDPVAAAITNAVFNAVGIRMTKLPITSEMLLVAIKAQGVKGGKPDATSF